MLFSTDYNVVSWILFLLAYTSETLPAYAMQILQKEHQQKIQGKLSFVSFGLVRYTTKLTIISKLYVCISKYRLDRHDGNRMRKRMDARHRLVIGSTVKPLRRLFSFSFLVELSALGKCNFYDKCLSFYCV